MPDDRLSILYTTEHERAEYAYKKKVDTVPENDVKEFKAAAERLPAMIQGEGLLPALTFYKAKTNLRSVYDVVSAWFQQRHSIHDQNWDLIDSRLLGISAAQYRADTQEALAFAAWLKRFAEAKHLAVKQQQEASRRETDREPPPARESQEAQPEKSAQNPSG